MPRVLWEPRPRGDSWGSARVFATGASLLQGDAPRFVGAPPSGRFLVVCEGYRDGGVAPTGGCPAFCGSPALGAILGGLRGFSRRGRRSYRGMPRVLWEPRPRGDSWWSARVIATGASLLQGDAPRFVGAPPSGRFLGVCECFRDGGVDPTGGSLCFLWESRPRGDGGWGAKVHRGQCAEATGFYKWLAIHCLS